VVAAVYDGSVNVREKPVGTIIFRPGEGKAGEVVYAAAKWRDSTGRQRLRRVGRAWVEADGHGGWRRRRGNVRGIRRPPHRRARDGHPHRRGRARACFGASRREATFADAVVIWRSWAEHTKRLKPATLRNYDALLSEPGQRKRGAGENSHGSCAHSQPENRRYHAVDIERSSNASTVTVSPAAASMRTQALANVFQHATRADVFALLQILFV